MHRALAIWLALGVLLGEWSHSPLQAQQLLPLPTCPARGLLAPGNTSTPFLSRHAACHMPESPLDDTDSQAAEQLFLFPDAWHQRAAFTGEMIYTGEVFSSVHGGINQATRYRGNLDLVLHAETSALDLWDSGRFFLYAGAMHGRTLSPADVGDYQYYSNLEGSPRPDNVFQVNEYWYEHAFADGDVVIKLGKQDAFADFAYVELGGDFVNTSFGWNPTVPVPTWPNPGMGAAMFLHVSDLLHLQAGVYDGSPGTGVQTGGQSGFSSLGRNGAISLFEVSLTPQLGSHGELPGTYRAGTWVHTGEFENLSTGSGTLSGSHGFYASGDQLIWVEPASEGDPQGLGLFAQYGWAPPDRSPVHQSLCSGLTYRGLIPQRDQDVLGLGIAGVMFADPALRTEQAIELFYKARFKHWLLVQPDAQYIARPSGSGRDALVVGLRTEMAF